MRSFRTYIFVLLCLWLNSVKSEIIIDNPIKKRINVEYVGDDFKQVLNLFEKQTGLYFQYDVTLKPLKRVYRLRYINEVAEIAIRDFLQQNGLDFNLVLGKSLVLKRWNPVYGEIVISGRISNYYTGERLVNAEVIVSGNEQNIIRTNSEGIFQLKSNQNKIYLKYDYPGFESQYDTLIKNGSSFFLDIIMKPEISMMELTEVNATGNKVLPTVEKGKSDEFSINRSQLNNIPHLLGEPDILRVFSMNPGVVSGSEGVFGMYVRGGASDQNLVLLDDAPLYNAYHLYGVFGIFNGDIIKNAKFYRGAFPANQGGRLSSVIEVNTREGNENNLTGNISIGLLSSRIYLGGPIFSKKTTYSIAARRSFFDYLVDPILSFANYSNNNFVNRYNFWDVNLKITHKFNQKSRMSVSGYSGQDFAGLIDKKFSSSNNINISERAEDASRWGNDLISARWDYMVTPSSQISFKSYITRYGYSHSRNYSIRTEFEDLKQEKVEKSNYEISNGIRDIEISAHFEKQINPSMSIKLGTGYINHYFQPNKRELSITNDSISTRASFSDYATTTPEIFGYLSYTLQSKTFGYYDVGIRSVYYSLGFGQYYILPEPRISARWKLKDENWIKFSASQTRQFFHQLNNLTMGLPSDLWVPSNTIFKPASATQFSIGYTKSMKMWQLSTEVFYRKFGNLLEYKDNAVYITTNRQWESSVTSGSGETKGWEIMLEKTKGQLTGWISYTLIKSDRTFASLNRGQTFPIRYDRRHNIYFLTNYRYSKKLNFSLNWTYNSGFAYTLPVGIFPSQTSNDPIHDVYIYGQRNNRRSRDNHRIDISATYKLPKKRTESSWVFGIYNVYNRMNPFYLNLGLGNDGGRSLYQVSLLPILPFINYQLSF